MLKHANGVNAVLVRGQPPSGGCVLKHALNIHHGGNGGQPPSGGCVLKQPIAVGRNYLLEVSRLRAAAC